MFGMNIKTSTILTIVGIAVVLFFAFLGLKCVFNFFDVVSLEQKDTYKIPEQLVDLVKSSIESVPDAPKQLVVDTAIQPLRDTEQDYPNVYKIGKVEYGQVFDKDAYFIGDANQVESLDKVNDGSLQQ